MKLFRMERNETRMKTKGIVKYLGIGELGVVELILALFPIMSAYVYSPIYLSFVIPALIIIYCILRGVTPINNKPLKYFAIYLVIHEVFLSLFYTYVGFTPITNMIGDVSHIIVILFAINIISIDKFQGSIMLVAICVSIGLLYHFIIISNGGTVTPIKFPLLPDPGASSRLHEIGERPVSFFWEPAAYASFMLLPLYIALSDKKYVLAGLFLFFIFLSTSTSGIILSVIMVLSWLFISQKGTFSKVITILILGGSFVYIITRTNLFEYGMTKMDNTNIEETARTINGPVLAYHLSVEDFFFGIPDNTPTDYWKKGKVVDSRLIGDEELYLSTFWYVLAKLGIIGLILYLSIFISAYNKNRALIPILLTIVVSLFSSNIYIGSHFVFFFMYMFLLKYKTPKSTFNEFKA